MRAAPFLLTVVASLCLPSAVTAGGPAASAALKPWTIPDPGSSQTRWILDPGFRDAALTAVTDSLAAVRWGLEWQDGPLFTSSVRDCRRFQSGLGGPISEDDYWVYSCRVPLVGGTWETFTYLLDARRRPTLQRVRWQFEFPSETNASTSDSVLRSLTDHLSRRFGRPTGEDTMRAAAPEGFGAQAGSVFDTRAGLLWAFLVRNGDPATEELEVERMSPVLVREAANRSEGSSEAFPGSEVDRSRVVRGQLAAVLVATHPDLARALRRQSPSSADLPAVERAMADARASASDVALLAVHRWLSWMQETTPGGAEWDRVRDGLARSGVRMETADSDTSIRYYCNSLLKDLAGRAGSNRWTDEAFAEWLERGAPTTCTCTEDRSSAVLEKGEAFLRAHPGSSAVTAIERAVAQAHESLWSMSLAPPENGYIDPWSLALSGPQHRDRAIILYRDVLRRAPGGWSLDRLRIRLRRLELEVDTVQRAFQCEDDD